MIIMLAMGRHGAIGPISIDISRSISAGDRSSRAQRAGGERGYDLQRHPGRDVHQCDAIIALNGW